MPEENVSWKFQFQLGAIGRSIGMQQEPQKKRFNSSLVRLGGVGGSSPSSGSQVSIPAWCDWEKQMINDSDRSILRFNSSLVRLGAKSSVLNVWALSSFNSSLVRLGATRIRLM